MPYHTWWVWIKMSGMDKYNMSFESAILQRQALMAGNIVTWGQTRRMDHSTSILSKTAFSELAGLRNINLFLSEGGLPIAICPGTCGGPQYMCQKRSSGVKGGKSERALGSA